MIMQSRQNKKVMIMTDLTNFEAYREKFLNWAVSRWPSVDNKYYEMIFQESVEGVLGFSPQQTEPTYNAIRKLACRKLFEIWWEEHGEDCKQKFLPNVKSRWPDLGEEVYETGFKIGVEKLRTEINLEIESECSFVQKCGFRESGFTWVGNHYEELKKRFLKWARVQWPVLDENDHKDAFHESVIILLHKIDSVIAKAVYSYIITPGFRELRKIWLGKDNIISFDDIFHSDQSTPKSDLDRRYLLRIAREAFDQLSDEEKDLLSGRIIHKMGWGFLFEDLSIDTGMDEEEMIRIGNKYRQRRASALKKLRKLFYALLKRDNNSKN